LLLLLLALKKGWVTLRSSTEIVIHILIYVLKVTTHTTTTLSVRSLAFATVIRKCGKQTQQNDVKMFDQSDLTSLITTSLSSLEKQTSSSSSSCYSLVVARSVPFLTKTLRVPHSFTNSNEFNDLSCDVRNKAVYY